MVNYYRVSFYRMPPKDSDDKEEFLGTVVVDDFGLEEVSVVGKAFRHANPNCLVANKTITEKV